VGCKRLQRAVDKQCVSHTVRLILGVSVGLNVDIPSILFQVRIFQ